MTQHVPDGFKIYWINLDSSTTRRKNLESRLENIGWADKSTRIQATDGTQVKDLISNQGIDIDNPNVAACTLSHLRAIRQAFDDGCEHAIIFEDDVTFDFCNYWKSSLKQLIDSAPLNHNILMLSWFCIQHKARLRLQTENTNNSMWIRHFKGIYGSFSYVISRKGMEHILKDRYNTNTGLYNIFTKKLKCDADWVLTDQEDVYVCTIPLFGYEAMDSTIHPKSVYSHRKHLEWMTDRIKSENIKWGK